MIDDREPRAIYDSHEDDDLSVKQTFSNIAVEYKMILLFTAQYVCRFTYARVLYRY